MTAAVSSKIWLSALICVVAAAPGWSNDYSEADPWQFDTTQDRANKALIADLIARQEADIYEITNVYNIAGDFVNCTQSANSIGNTETIAQEAPIGSPRVTVEGQIGSEAAGNAGSTEMIGGSAGIPQSGMNTGIARGSNGGRMSGSSQAQRASGNSVLRASSDQALTGNASETVQSNRDSSVAASVRSSDMPTEIGSTSGSGGSGRVALNSRQSVDGSTVRAGISESSACAFTRLTGTGQTTLASGEGR